jgi:hypothetical protein
MPAVKAIGGFRQEIATLEVTRFIFTYISLEELEVVRASSVWRLSM